MKLTAGMKLGRYEIPDGSGAGGTPPRQDKTFLRAAAALYTADALSYQESWAPVLRPHGKRLIESLPLDGCRRILDAGAGVGSLLPELAAAAPGATVVAADCSHGMLARAPAGYPRVTMDLGRCALAAECFDAAIAAFVLFHLADPRRGLRELRRVLRPGGALGTITWDGEPRFPAQLAWNEELNAHGAAPGDVLLNHEPLCSPEKMERLLHSAGYDGVRTWTVELAHRYGREGFLAMRTSRGSSRRRVESLLPEQRASFWRRVHERFARMRADDFVDRSLMIFATAVRP